MSTSSSDTESESSHPSDTDEEELSSSSSSSSSSHMPEPYSFEPSVSDSEDSSGTSSEEDSERLTDLSWCECGHCNFMATVAECVCCKEISRIVAKMNEAGGTTVTCITEHPGFAAVCLNVWVLQAAYYHYRQEHGTASSPSTTHECTPLKCLRKPIQGQTQVSDWRGLQIMNFLKCLVPNTYRGMMYRPLRQTQASTTACAMGTSGNTNL